MDQMSLAILIMYTLNQLYILIFNYIFHLSLIKYFRV